MPKVQYGDTGLMLEFPDGMSQQQMADAINSNKQAIEAQAAAVKPAAAPAESPTRLDLSKVNYERQGYYYPGPGQQGAFDPNTADLTTPPVGRPGVIPTDPNDAARIAGTPQAAGIEDIAAAVPFLGGAKQALDSAALKEAALRVKAGTHTPSDLQTLKRFQMDSARGTTFGKDIAAGVAGSARLGGQAAISSIAGPVGSAAGMLLDPGTIVSRYNAQTTPEVKFDDAGGVTVGESPSKTKEEALKKVAALQTSDALIEMFGGKAVAGAMGAGGKVLGKVAGKYLPETSAAVKAVAKRYGDNTAANLLQRGQIHGIIPEYMEEVMQSVANYNIGEPGQDPKALLDPTNPEALKTALIIGILNSPRLAGMLQKRKDDTPAPPSSDASANVVPTGDMNLTLTPEQPVTQSDVADIFAMFDEPAAQPAAETPTPPVARQTPDTLPPLPPGAVIPVQGTSAPRAQQPAVAPIAPGSAVMRPVPTLTPEEVQAWSEEADALAPGEQEIVADYLMQNPGNPEQLSPREIVARGRRDVWRMTPDEQAQYEQAMGLNEQPAEATAPAQPQETTNEEVQGQGRQEEVAPPTPTPRGRKAKQAPVTPVEATTPETAPTPAPPAVEAATAPPAPISPAVEPAKRPAPPRKGSTSPTGWKGRTATVDGRQLEVAKDKDGTWNALIDGDVVSLGHKTATDAREAAEQDMRDQRNASEEDQAGQGRGPAPADTGIYRDLTAAAREGKRFVAELHERIAPALERIYAQSKNAVDFVKQAVAKIGKHIRPYAKRFAAEVKRGVRATNAEFRQNPTRGSGPLPSRKQPKAQRESNKAFSAGFNRGQHFGGMRTREEITAFLERASAVLPKEQFAARLKIAKKLLSTDLQSDQKRQDRFNRFIEATRTQVYKAKTISDIAKQSGKLQSAMKKMEPSLKSVVKEVLATFSETKPTDATIQKAEALLMAVADGKTIAHPKAVAAAEKAIDTFLNDKSLASMPLDRLRRLKDTLENMNALHEGNMEQLKEARRELKRQYEQAAKDISDNTETPFEGDEAARKGLIRWVMRDVGMNINNKLLALAPEGSTLHEIAIRMTDAGENRESAHRIEARDYIMGRLAKLKGSDGKPLVVRHPSDDSYTLHPEFEAMSLMLSDYANKTPLGKAIARKRGKAPELIGTQLPSGKNIYLTSAERVRLYQLGLDPNARYQITREGSEGIYLPRKASDKIQKLTPADLTAIEASLTDNEKAIAQAMFEFDNGRAKEAVNEMSRKEFGRDLFAEDDKTSYRRYQHDKEVGSMTEHVGKTFIENQGMLKDITGGTSPIVLGDALSEYFAHQARVAAIVGRMTPSMRLRELASTESFREAVRKSSAQGENALRDIERHFEKYGQISGEQDTAMWAVNGILSRLASAWLGFNPKTIITTPLSAWSMQSRIPTRYLIKNASPRTRDSKVLAEIRKHAPKMYEMMTSSGFSVVSPETTGESAQKFFGKGARGHERAQFFLHEANNIPAIMAWKSSKDWGESQGLTGDALIKFTAEKAQDAYSVSQPDNRWKYTSGAKLDARSSAFWRVATFLQGQTSKQYNQAVEAALAYRYSDRSAAAKAKAVKDMAVPLLGQAILYNAVGYAVMGAKDEWDKMRGEKASRLKDKTAKDFAFDTLRSATENIMIAGPIVSDAADVARRGLRGESPPRVVSGSESALARPLTLAFKLIYQSARAWDKPSKERLTAMRKSIVEAASLMGFDTSIINEALDMAAER